MPNGYPTRPEDLVIDKDGKPLRIDKAYSWESPLAAHGLMHMVITNAANHDPYPIDTLLLFMANMAWNSSMNTGDVREMLARTAAHGEYAIPFLVVVDAFQSETVNFADLVLPDTTYLERYDAISLLDRPISEPDAAADAIRHPISSPIATCGPGRTCWSSSRRGSSFRRSRATDGSRKFADYRDFIVNYEKLPGIGFLAGWRGKDGESHLRGEPNPKQWEKYIENQSFFTLSLAGEHALLPVREQGLSRVRRKARAVRNAAGAGDPADVFGAAAEVSPRRAGSLRRTAAAVADRPRAAGHVFRSAAVLVRAAGRAKAMAREAYPFHAITQRPMMMYHSWDSQNAWLRQIIAQNYLYMNRGSARKLGLADYDWVWVESRHARIRCQLKTMEGVEANTVWTWNAIGSQAGPRASSRTRPKRRRASCSTT